MDKAEERALECYPSLTNSFDRSKRLVYRNGYHQAEKDLALTWKDVETIVHIYEIAKDVVGDYDIELYEEVLTRFKQLKEGNK